jgi:4-aminobutyrate aminotransferase-like enzyme/Ser/Thr protein kinase RdoA (MazF antagonist)
MVAIGGTGMISALEAARIAREHYGLEGGAHGLAGEYDLNYRLETNQKTFLLKIAAENSDRELLEYQNAVMNHISIRAPQIESQHVIANVAGKMISEITLEGETRLVRLLSYAPGRTLASTKPHTRELLESLGERLAEMDVALEGFSHPSASKPYKWNLAQADVMMPLLEKIDSDSRRAIAEKHLNRFSSSLKSRIAKLPSGVIHSDANDYNVIVTGTGFNARVSSVIDFGDAVLSPIICDLAIALAYTMLGKPDPVASASHVVRGYHRVRPLSETELEVLYPLVLTRLAVSVCNSANEKRLRPDDAYAVISEAPAWALLEHLEKIHENLATGIFRNACNLEPIPNAIPVREWLLEHQSEFGRIVDADLKSDMLEIFDLSVASTDLGLPDEIDSPEKLTKRLFDQMATKGACIGVGRYLEPRIIYANDDFVVPCENGPERRTMHMAHDYFLKAGEAVFAPIAGTIHSFQDNTAELDFGPCIILEHQVSHRGQAITFYTLYGHLTRTSLEGLQVGQPIEANQKIAEIGPYPENGNWPPHLHFQVITDLLGQRGEFPGVARPSELAVRKSISLDPNLIAQIPERLLEPAHQKGSAILEQRRARIGGNLSISYKRNPLTIARARGQYLFDEHGQRFLDCYNNVPHVGHTHPHVVRAAIKQMQTLNTNTRYLHENLVRYAERLTAKLPSSLSVCYFVSSGSEATELALRLARAHTGAKDLIVSDHAYHGHTTTLIDISPYKAQGPGGLGLPDWVHKVAVADVYRGEFKRDDKDAGLKYAKLLEPILERIRGLGRKLSGFVIESIPSVGGQIVLPDGYLQEVYRLVRAAGGVCIADEVQTGFGRIGSHFWGFEAQGVTPDIVAMGKPIGNGYPLGAVVTTPEIAAAFNNGMEYFATFGGNPVSCAVGMAVLDVLELENLQAHALELGNHLMDGMRELQNRHTIIGDVRGLGLFNGLEFVTDHSTLEPAAKQADYVVERLRECGILAGTDGPYHNVLKLRGPMVITRNDVDFFLETLDQILLEDGAQA